MYNSLLSVIDEQRNDRDLPGVLGVVKTDMHQ